MIRHSFLIRVCVIWSPWVFLFLAYWISATGAITIGKLWRFLRPPPLCKTNILFQRMTVKEIFGLGQFGAAVSATSLFGDGTFRRWWSEMFYAKKMCVFEILRRLDCKGCFLQKCFLLSSWWPVASIVSRPSRFWKNIVRPWSRA